MASEQGCGAVKTSIAEKVKSLRTRGRRRTRYTLVFVCMAVLVGLCVQLALRQRGITLTATSEVLDCHLAGMVAHKHSAECYDSKGNLICTLPERELHTHDESCYSADGKLVCGKDEIATEHVHGPGCFRTITAGAETVSVQSFKQQLKDESGKDVITIDVSAPRDALPKGATMKAALLDQAKVDQTLVQDAVNKLSGGKVLKTQAVDISFFDADGKEIEPEKNVVVKLTSSLVNAANAPVVVHVEDQREATERAAAQGTTDPKPEGTVVRRMSSQELELRDEALNKNQIAFESSDFSTYVLATTSMRHTMHAGDKSTVVVDVDAPAEAGLPADAKLQIKEVDKESEEWKKYEQQALTAIGKESASYARFFDIKIVTADGEVQPARDVAVSIELKDAPAAVQDSAKVVHFSGDKPEVVASREDSGTTKFQASGFSVYGVMYTVDFEYQGFTYALPGTQSMLLSELMAALGIQESVADVAEVTFTNPELLKVEKAQPGATIKRLNEDSMGNAKSDAAEPITNLDEKLVEQPLAEGEDFEPLPELVQEVPVPEGDWIITSLKSFETEETLAVKTASKVYEIKVTDPPNPWGPGYGLLRWNEHVDSRRH